MSSAAPAPPSNLRTAEWVAPPPPEPSPFVKLQPNPPTTGVIARSRSPSPEALPRTSSSVANSTDGTPNGKGSAAAAAAADGSAKFERAKRRREQSLARNRTTPNGRSSSASASSRMSTASVASVTSVASVPVAGGGPAPGSVSAAAAGLGLAVGSVSAAAASLTATTTSAFAAVAAANALLSPNSSRMATRSMDRSPSPAGDRNGSAAAGNATSAATNGGASAAAGGGAPSRPGFMAMTASRAGSIVTRTGSSRQSIMPAPAGGSAAHRSSSAHRPRTANVTAPMPAVEPATPNSARGAAPELTRTGSTPRKRLDFPGENDAAANGGFAIPMARPPSRLATAPAGGGSMAAPLSTSAAAPETEAALIAAVATSPANASDSVKVFVRIRPMTSDELGEEKSITAANGDSSSAAASNSAEAADCVTATTPTNGSGPLLTVRGRSVAVAGASTPFLYDGVFDGLSATAVGASQDDVFEAVGRPLADNCLNGYHATVFAYGQTGAGKTWTMMGGEDAAQKGLIPRMLDCIFGAAKQQLLAQEQARELAAAAAAGGALVPGVTVAKKFRFSCSFIEIYNETPKDLLADGDSDDKSEAPSIRENPDGTVYVDPCVRPAIDSADAARSWLARGLARRTTSATKMNEQSSRSHAIFTLDVETTTATTTVAAPVGAPADAAPVAGTRTERTVSCLHLVDLAGSESQRTAQTAGLHLKEAGKINQSLMALGKVITVLSEQQAARRQLAAATAANGAAPAPKEANSKASAHVPYRDSKLTFLLKNALGGNSKTCLIAAVSPVVRCRAETLSTLQFAANAKKITNDARVNRRAVRDREAKEKEAAAAAAAAATAKEVEALHSEMAAAAAENKRLRSDYARASGLLAEAQAGYWETLQREAKAVAAIGEARTQLDSYHSLCENQESSLQELERKWDERDRALRAARLIDDATGAVLTHAAGAPVSAGASSGEVADLRRRLGEAESRLTARESECASLRSELEVEAWKLRNRQQHAHGLGHANGHDTAAVAADHKGAAHARARSDGATASDTSAAAAAAASATADELRVLLMASEAANRTRQRQLAEWAHRARAAEWRMEHALRLIALCRADMLATSSLGGGAGGGAGAGASKKEKTAAADGKQRATGNLWTAVHAHMHELVTGAQAYPPLVHTASSGSVEGDAHATPAPAAAPTAAPVAVVAEPQSRSTPSSSSSSSGTASAPSSGPSTPPQRMSITVQSADRSPSRLSVASSSTAPSIVSVASSAASAPAVLGEHKEATATLPAATAVNRRTSTIPLPSADPAALILASIDVSVRDPDLFNTLSPTRLIAHDDEHNTSTAAGAGAGAGAGAPAHDAENIPSAANRVRSPMPSATAPVLSTPSKPLPTAAPAETSAAMPAVAVPAATTAAVPVQSLTTPAVSRTVSATTTPAAAAQKVAAVLSSLPRLTLTSNISAVAVTPARAL